MTVCAARSMHEAEYTHHTILWIAPPDFGRRHL